MCFVTLYHKYKYTFLLCLTGFFNRCVETNIHSYNCKCACPEIGCAHLKRILLFWNAMQSVCEVQKMQEYAKEFQLSFIVATDEIFSTILKFRIGGKTIQNITLSFIVATDEIFLLFSKMAYLPDVSTYRFAPCDDLISFCMLVAP